MKRCATGSVWLEVISTSKAIMFLRHICFFPNWLNFILSLKKRQIFTLNVFYLNNEGSITNWCPHMKVHRRAVLEKVASTT